MRRTLVLSAIVLVGLSGVWTHAAQQQPAAAQPAALDPANFTGTVTARSIGDIRTLRYHFDPSARTNWHVHEGGQVIFVQEGRARTQERGGTMRELAQGTTAYTAPGVAHWHGAAPGAGGMTQVSLSFGATKWMEKVSDGQYSASTR
jgi:quercetin dioxygenase-like cupin family protein